MKSFFHRYPITSFIILSYGFLWLGAVGMLSGFIPQFGEWPLTHQGQEVVKIRLWRTLLIWTPNFAAMMMVGMLQGRKGVWDLLSRFFHWRVSWKWWAAAFLIPLSLAGISVMLYARLGGSLELGLIKSLPGIFFVHCLYSLTASGFAEEAGWRGFALPRLQAKYGPLIASIFVGAIWCFWHAPVWIVQQVDGMSIVNFLILMIGLSIVYTWIFNHSQGSLLLMAVIHNTGNAIDATLTTSFAAIMPNRILGDIFNVVLLVFALLLIGVTKAQLGFAKHSQRNL